MDVGLWTWLQARARYTTDQNRKERSIWNHSHCVTLSDQAKLAGHYWQFGGHSDCAILRQSTMIIVFYRSGIVWFQQVLLTIIWQEFSSQLSLKIPDSTYESTCGLLIILFCTREYAWPKPMVLLLVCTLAFAHGVLCEQLPLNIATPVTIVCIEVVVAWSWRYTVVPSWADWH